MHKGIKQYKKKPLEIEAVQFVYWNAQEILDWGIQHRTHFIAREEPHPNILIPTSEGCMQANVGDYIIKGIKGEFYPCKPDIFLDTYDLVLIDEDENK